MLHQELPAIDSTPLDGWGRWLAPALIVGARPDGRRAVLLVGQSLLAAIAVVRRRRGRSAGLRERAEASRRRANRSSSAPDFSLLGSALGLSRDPTALTTSEGSVLIVNAAYRERFGGNRPPLSLASDDEARQGLELASTMAWRDGAGCVAGIATSAGVIPGRSRAGRGARRAAAVALSRRRRCPIR